MKNNIGILEVSRIQWIQVEGSAPTALLESGENVCKAVTANLATESFSLDMLFSAALPLCTQGECKRAETKSSRRRRCQTKVFSSAFGRVCSLFAMASAKLHGEALG